jgi:hypothetical protein
MMGSARSAPLIHHPTTVMHVIPLHTALSHEPAHRGRGGIFRVAFSAPAILLGSTLFALAATEPVVLENYKGGETIRYTVPLIRGTLADKDLTTVEVVNESSKRDTARMTCLAYGGRFKALTELVPGVNHLVIQAGKHRKTLDLTYQPQTNANVVRMVYAVDSTGDTTYQTPVKGDAQDYVGKLGTMMLMMQTFSAERMNDIGMGRKTFNLELDANGKVKVHVMKCNKTAQEVFTMGGGRGKLFSYLAGQTNQNLPSKNSRNVIYAGFSRFNPETKQNMAYTALGGGNTAVFGGTNMYCYPSRLADVQKAFMNATPIDTDNFSSDSAGRHAFWANASTSIGATLHETGHTFDLPHVRDWTGVMSRGFDFFSRFWTLQEAPKRGQTKLTDFKEDRAAKWELGSAAFLNSSPWFALDAREYPKENRIQARLGTTPDSFIVESPDGIGAVILGRPGLVSGAVPMDWTKPAPKSVAVTTQMFDPKDDEGGKAWLRIIDSQGHVKNVPLKNLRAPTPPPPVKK